MKKLLVVLIAAVGVVAFFNRETIAEKIGK